VAAGVDRLRWLFGGTLTWQILNLESQAAQVLPSAQQAREDHAAVSQVIQPGGDPWRLLDPSGNLPSAGSVVLHRSARAARVPRYPVVFCHGMLAYSTVRMRLPENLNCFSALEPFLRERGCRVFCPQVLATGSVAERAGQLRDYLLRNTEGPVNLVAHSMGGLDARYLISHLGMADRVRSLTTISTPHRGTYLAEWFVANFRNRVPLLLALEAMGVNVDGFRDCQRAACRAFNEQTPDVPGVQYFSYGGVVPVSRVSPALRRAWQLITLHEGPNDGMVSLTSARWGQYLGTLAADHFAQTPDATFLRAGEDFDSLGFCTRLVEDLARRSL
jgi:triacylglycerol lipase